MFKCLNKLLILKSIIYIPTGQTTETIVQKSLSDAHLAKYTSYVCSVLGMCPVSSLVLQTMQLKNNVASTYSCLLILIRRNFSFT